jgi:hypothetical protein
VLEYLSSAAGFVVLKEGQVDGRVTVMSKQPVSADVAVTMLSAVLRSNGFTATQDGRVLKVVARDKAKKQSVPVHYGSDPDGIARRRADHAGDPAPQHGRRQAQDRPPAAAEPRGRRDRAAAATR